MLPILPSRLDRSHIHHRNPRPAVSELRTKCSDRSGSLYFSGACSSIVHDELHRDEREDYGVDGQESEDITGDVGRHEGYQVFYMGGSYDEEDRRVTYTLRS